MIAWNATIAPTRPMGKLYGLFAGVGIFISCLGLLGLVTYATEQRTKEIGVRKIMGAGNFGILSLLSKEFIKLILIANLIAWPDFYYFLNSWLQNFAYRIDIGWVVFVLAGGVAVDCPVYDECAGHAGSDGESGGEFAV